MEFLMQDAVARRHPLHIARPDDTTATGGIAVLQLAVIDDRHRLEALVGMFSHPTAAFGRPEHMRTRVIEQQERAQMLAERIVGKQGTNRKTVADPVAAVVSVAAENFLLHCHPPCSRRQHEAHLPSVLKMRCPGIVVKIVRSDTAFY